MDVGIKTANDQIQTLTTTERTAIASPVVGQIVFDSTLKELFVYINATTGNAWQGIGNLIICASTTRPLTPFEGQMIYETDTQRYLSYTGSAWTSIFDTDVWSISDTILQGETNDSSLPVVLLKNYTSDVNSSQVKFTKARGTTAAPTLVLDGDILGQLRFDGLYAGTTTFGTAASINAIADGNFSGSSVGAYIQFGTVATGTSSPRSERMRIGSNGFTTITGTLGRGTPVTKTASFTLASTENYVICNNASNAALTVTLPAAASWTGREVMIKNINGGTLASVISASSNVVPINSSTAGTAILPVAQAGAWVTLVSNGTSWVATESTTNTLTDAGHLIVANTAARPSSPTVGQMVYQTDVDELLKYVSYGSANRWMQADVKPNRNAIINGGFSVDQRNNGASQTLTAVGTVLAYTVDRWYAVAVSANNSIQRITGTTPYTNAIRFTGGLGNTATVLGTRLEAVNTKYLAGKTATLSAIISASSITSVTWTAYYATTTDSFGTYNVPTRTQIATGTFSGVTATDAYYSASLDIPSAATTGIEIVFTTGGNPSTQTITYSGVQLEKGAAPSEFEFYDYGNELRRCQRYYYRQGPYVSGTQRFGSGIITTTSSANILTQFPVTLRSVPTAVEQSGTVGNYGVNNLAVTTACVTTVPTFSNASIDNATTTFTTAATLVAGQACQGVNNSTTTAYLGWSAEL